LIKSPFPYFGGKSRAASLIWSGLGNVPNFVDPFMGSLAIVLSREGYDPSLHTETVNDIDCYLSNFFRAIAIDPEAVAHWADYPVIECDLHARHLWLINQSGFREKMKTDPDFYDPKIAGWWVWGLCAWSGSGWCVTPSNQLPHLGNGGRGIHRKLPHLGDGGKEETLLDYFQVLSDRLRRVRVCCGDCQRVLTPSVTIRHGVTGVLLDPPYDRTLRDADLYANESDVSTQSREWAIENGANPLFRVALCGYSDEHLMPSNWQCIKWKAGGGYDGQKSDRSNLNRKKERIWFSPHCLKVGDKSSQLSLLEVS